MKNKHLLLLFAATLAIGLSVHSCGGGCGRPFEGNLFDCDTTLLAEFSYQKSTDDTAEVTCARGGGRWFCTQNGKTISPSEEFAARFLTALKGVKIRQIAARLPVEPGGEKAFFGKETETAQLSFLERPAGRKDGKTRRGPFFFFEKKNADGPPTPMARLATGEEAFELESGDLLALLKTPFLELRDRRLFRLKKGDVLALAFNSPNRPPVMLDLVDGRWLPPGSPKPAPAARIAELFRVLKKVENGLPFARNFGEMEKSRAFATRLMVSTGAATGSFSLTGYRRADRPGFVVTSSHNPDNFFELPDSLAMPLFSDPTGF